jgi:uncharacterized repeat protein (TIGR03803 family)
MKKLNFVRELLLLCAGSEAITARAAASGSVLARGYDGHGQTAQSEITAIAAEDVHTVALKNYGSVVAWGYNNYGQPNVRVAANLKPVRWALRLTCLVLVLLLLASVSGAASNFTTLHSFDGWLGSSPYAGLTLSDDIFYGTASNGGGGFGPGAIFSIHPDGTGYTNLHGITSDEGAQPSAELILAGDTLYGTTSGLGNYGPSGSGAVFAVKTNGTGYTNLYTFSAIDPSYYTNRDGRFPRCRLVLSGNTLFGTTSDGGSKGKGTLFAVRTDGTGFTNLHNFAGLSTSPGDGSAPYAGLVLSGNTLYGTTPFGSGIDNGTVFKINTDGNGYAIIHTFSFTTYSTNWDGANPFAELTLAGDILYGTAANGGMTGGRGTVFALGTNGSNFRTLYSFSIASSSAVTNSDGAHPYGGVIRSGGTLYGTATFGGYAGNGTVFAVATNGTGFRVLRSFTPRVARDDNYSTNSDGANPRGRLILSGNVLYGTAEQGGTIGLGTVFSLSLPQPRLSIAWTTKNAMSVSWPSPSTGFTLQQNTIGVAAANWSNVLATPADNGTTKSVIVNSATGNGFFRLKLQ